MPAAGPAGVFRQPQLGALYRRHRCGHARQRYSSCGGVHHVGVERLFQLHAVCRGYRPRAQAAGPDAPELVKLRTYFDHPLFVEMFADAVTPPPAPCPPTRGWCSPRIRSRWPRTGAAARTSTAAKSLTPQGWSLRLRATEIRRLRPGVAVAFGPTAGSLAGARRRRPPEGARAQRRHRLSHRVCRRPHRGGVGSRPRVTRASRGRGHGVRTSRHAQRRSAIRPAGNRFDRRTALRQAAGAGSGPDPVPGCLASVDGAPCRPPHCAAPESD